MHLSRLNQHATSNPGPSFLAGRDRLARRMNGSTTENPKRDIPHSSWIERRAKRPPSVSDVDPGDRCPERRRRAALVRPERYRASERQVCRVVGQHRSTQRHPAKVISIEKAKLRHRLWEIASEHIRWGRRMAYRLLRREGGHVSQLKKIHFPLEVTVFLAQPVEFSALVARQLALIGGLEVTAIDAGLADPPGQGAVGQAPRLLLAGRVIARELWRRQSEQRGRLSCGA